MVLALSSHDERGIRYCLGTGSVLSEMRSEGAAWIVAFKKVGSETWMGILCRPSDDKISWIIRLSCHRYDYFQLVDSIILSFRDSIVSVCK